MTARVAIVGSREHPNLELVREYVRGLPDGSIVISGGADGVDEAAASEARARRMHVIVFAPEHPTRVVVSSSVGGDSYRERENIGISSIATPRDVLLFRNTWIAVACTRMVAFVDGSRGGTWDAVKQAERFKRPVEIVRAK